MVLFTGANDEHEYLLTTWSETSAEIATRPAGSGLAWGPPVRLTAPDAQEEEPRPKTPEQHLTDIANLMVASKDSFVVAIGAEVGRIARDHALWAAECVGDPHQHVDIPCEEFERALSHALHWLRGAAETRFAFERLAARGTF